MKPDPSSQDMIAGRRAVAEILGRRAHEVQELIYSGGGGSGAMKDILALARSAGIKVRKVERARLDQLLRNVNHQGVALRLAAMAYVELSEILAAARQAGDQALLVMADHLQDPHNLGAVARSAAAAGAQGLIVAKDRSCPLSPAVAKAASGALEHLPIARVTNLTTAVEKIKAAGLWLLGASTRNAPAPWEHDLAMPLCLVVGSEHKGLGKRLAGACDLMTSLPLSSKVESLNASVAAGVLLFEIVRQRAIKNNQ